MIDRSIHISYLWCTVDTGDRENCATRKRARYGWQTMFERSKINNKNMITRDENEYKLVWNVMSRYSLSIQTSFQSQIRTISFYTLLVVLTSRHLCSSLYVTFYPYFPLSLSILNDRHLSTVRFRFYFFFIPSVEEVCGVRVRVCNVTISCQIPNSAIPRPGINRRTEHRLTPQVFDFFPVQKLVSWSAAEYLEFSNFNCDNQLFPCREYNINSNYRRRYITWIIKIYIVIEYVLFYFVYYQFNINFRRFC